MASPPDAMDIDGRKDDTSADTRAEDDDPEARLRRRERREALKQAAQGEEDESLLDVSDSEETPEDPPAAIGQPPPPLGEAPLQPAVHTVPATPVEVQPPPPAADPVTTATADENASGSGKSNNKKTFVRQPVELKFVNCVSKANPSGAGEKLKKNPAFLYGAGQAEPNPRGGESLLGHSDSTNSSYISVAALKKSSMTNPNIMHGGRVERETDQIGSFDSKRDGRIALCHIRSVIEKKQNISTSFSPKNLTCSSCPARGEHPVCGEEGPRQCFVLSDQNFPGCVPVPAGECLKIIRIENGMLGELVGCFLDLFRGKILPAGSTVVLFSATHLLMRGLSGYISDLSNEMNRLDRVFRGGILSLPGIPIFIDGCNNRTVTRETIEFGEWAKTTGEPFPAETWEALGSGIIADSSGGIFRQEKTKIPVPESFRNSQKERSWVSGGWASPCGAQPVDSELEKTLIGALITELNSLFNLGLGKDTIHDRLIEVQDAPARRYLFIGGSHAATEGNVMADRGHEVIVCAVSGWRPNKTAVEEMAARVEEALLELTPNDVIVLHLFDNVAYMARSEEGGDLPIRQFINGEYHVEGDLVIAGKDRLYMFFKNALPLLKLLEGRKVIFLIPLPRYIAVGCCEDDEHAPNRADPGFEANLRAGLAEARGHFKDFLFSNNLKFKILNPGLCVPLSSEDGDPMWSEEDPVHPLYNGYEAIIDLIEQEADSLRTGKKRPGGDIAPPAKKPRAEVTRPRWVDQAETPVVMHGGYPPSSGRPWIRARGFGGGRFRRAGGGRRGGGYY